MELAGKPLGEYFVWVRIPVAALIALSLVSFCLGIVNAFAIFFGPIIIITGVISLGWGLLSIVLSAGIVAYIGWSAAREHKAEVAQAAVAGALAGLIAGVAGSVLGIVQSVISLITGVGVGIVGGGNIGLLTGALAGITGVLGVMLAVFFAGAGIAASTVIAAIIAAIGALIAGKV